MTKSGAAGLLVLLLLSACTTTQPGAQTQAPGQTQEPGASAATWAGTLTYRFTESVSQSGGGVTSESSQTYEATVRIRSEQTDIRQWKLVGEANITAERSIFFETTTPCLERHKDDASAAAEAVAILDGALEVSEELYQFWVQLPDVDGSERSVREYGCGGTNSDETHTWVAGAGGQLGGSGEPTDPNAISGSSTDPDGRSTTTWSLTRSP